MQMLTDRIYVLPPMTVPPHYVVWDHMRRRITRTPR